MHYFILKQDERIPNVIKPIGLTDVIEKEWIQELPIYELEKQSFSTFMKEQSQALWVDFLEKPYPLLSDRFKKLMEVYVPHLPFVPVVFNDMKNKKQATYWLMIPPKVACLADSTEFNRDGTVKTLVIEEEKANTYPLFQVEGIKEPYMIINLALAESILRRSYDGIRIQKVRTNGNWNEAMGSHLKRSFYVQR